MSYHHYPVRFVRLAQIHRLLVPVQLVRIQFVHRRLVLDVLRQRVRLVGLLGADLKLGKVNQRLELGLLGMGILLPGPERLDKAAQRQFQLLGLRNQIQSRDVAMGSQWFRLDQQGNRCQLGLGNCTRRPAAGLVGTMVPSKTESSLPMGILPVDQLMERIQLVDHRRRLVLDRVGRSCNRSGP